MTTIGDYQPDNLSEKIGGLIAQVTALNTSVLQIQQDLRELSSRVSDLNSKVTLHASFFGFIGSIITVSTSGLIKRLLGH